MRGGAGADDDGAAGAEMLAVSASLAVMVCLPAVLRLATKIPLPPVKVALAGRLAWVSLLEKWTVPV